jgi:hypothetical protein
MLSRTANIADELAAVEIRAALQGKRCWYVYRGVDCTFGMDLGRKVPRDKQEVMAMERARDRVAKRGQLSSWHPDEYVKYKGESHLLVWCSWRIDAAEGPLASSDNEPDLCESVLRRLIGKTVQRVDIGAGWEMRLAFSSDMTLNVFPNFVGPKADFDGNWELWKPDQAYLIGTDLTCEVIDRENRPMQPRPGQGRWAVVEKAAPQKVLATKALARVRK